MKVPIIEEELNKRIQTANRVYCALQGKFLGHKEITRKTNIPIYKAINLIIFLHGPQNQTLTKRQDKRTQASEMKFYRGVLRVGRTEKKKNEL